MKMASKIVPLEARLWELFHSIDESDEVGRQTVGAAIEAVIYAEAFADQVFHKTKSLPFKEMSDDMRLMIGKEPYVDD